MPLEDRSNPTRNDVPTETQTESTARSTTLTTTTNGRSVMKGTVLLQTASCMAVSDHSSIPVLVVFVFFCFFFLRKDHSYPQIAKANLGGWSEIDIFSTTEVTEHTSHRYACQI